MKYAAVISCRSIAVQSTGVVVSGQIRRCVEIGPEIGWPVGGGGNYEDALFGGELMQRKLSVAQPCAENAFSGNGAKGGGEGLNQSGTRAQAARPSVRRRRDPHAGARPAMRGTPL